MTWKCRFVILLAWISTGYLLAGEALKPTMVIGFNEGFDGKTNLGKVKAVRVGNPQLVEGKFGKAMKSGPSTGYLQFNSKGILKGEEGSIEMWVKRIGWKPDDREFHVFFETLGKKSWLAFYKYSVGSKVFMLTGQKHRGPYNIGAYTSGYNHADKSAKHNSPQKWNNDWAHLVGTWSKAGNSVYINGIPGKLYPRKEFYGRGNFDFGKTFRLGDISWIPKRSSSSLIDEVKIYDKALSAEEVAAHYNKAIYNGQVPLTKKTVSLKYSADLHKKQLLVEIYTGGANLDKRTTAVKCAIVPEKSKVADSDWQKFSYQPDVTKGILPLPDKTGKYEIVVVFKANTGITEVRKEVVIPDFSWYDNRIGMEHKVLKPWTPLKTKGNTVMCWGREYRFGKSALPEQIVSRDKEILARPISIDAEIDGTSVKWYKQSIKKIFADKVEAKLQGEMHGHAGKSKILIKTEFHIEYDGFMVINISADKPGLFSKLSLNIPVSKTNALYHHRYSNIRAGIAGNVPAGNGVVDKSVFVPFAWLGDNERGLFWCCESDQFWPNGQKSNALEEVRDVKSVSMRFNILQKGQKFTKNWKYEFALQATPVKPLPANWRKLRFIVWENNDQRQWPGANVAFFNWGANGVGSKYGYPESENPRIFKEQIKITQVKKIKLLPYLNLSCQPTFCDEWPFFGEKWRMGYFDLDPVGIDRRHGYAAVSTKDKDYRDFVIWKLDKYRREMDLDGEYHDNTFPYQSDRSETGCGYTRDGKRYPSYTIFATRTLLRRNMAARKAFKKDSFSIAHMSSKVWIPLLAYEDAMLDGEHFRGRIKDSYPELMPMDMFRAEYMGRQWGLIPIMLLQLTSENAKKIKPTRGILTMAMLHDTKIWGMNGRNNKSVIQEAQKLLDEFKYANAQFIPYFDKNPPASTKMKNVYISVYKRKDKQVMLIIGNLERNGVSGKVKINFKRLGINPGSVIDWQTKEAIELKDDNIEISIPGQGYKMIVIENFTAPIPNAWG